MPGGYQDIVVTHTSNNATLLEWLHDNASKYGDLIEFNADGSVNIPLGSPRKQAPLLDYLGEQGYDVSEFQKKGAYAKFADTKNKAPDDPSPDDVRIIALLDDCGVDFGVETKAAAAARETSQEALGADSSEVVIVDEEQKAFATGRHMKNGVQPPEIPIMVGIIDDATKGREVLKSDGRIERPAFLTLEEWRRGIETALEAAQGAGNPKMIMDAIAVANKFNAALEIVSSQGAMYDPASVGIDSIDITPYVRDILDDLSQGLDTVELIYGSEMRQSVGAML